jgi:hypothetical protein
MTEERLKEGWMDAVGQQKEIVITFVMNTSGKR